MTYTEWDKILELVEAEIANVKRKPELYAIVEATADAVEKWLAEDAQEIERLETMYEKIATRMGLRSGRAA